MDIIKRKKIFLSFSFFMVAVATSALIFYWFTPGVDFKSGSLWQMRLPGVEEKEVRVFLQDSLKVSEPIISYDASADSYALLLPEMSPERKAADFEALKARFPGAEELDFWSTSPSVSSELKNKAFLAIALVLLVISLYVTLAFSSVSWPISSYKYGIAALIALIHDAVIAAGFYAILSHFKGLVADTNLIVALLTIVGFSVHDTIVVFDRIRENFRRRNDDVDKTINRSVNETFRRSISTSLTLILVLLAIYFWGPTSMRYFSLTILVGAIVGVYSSIFLASPILSAWYHLDAKRKK
jgi:preprotein translocase subunit SecF